MTTTPAVGQSTAPSTKQILFTLGDPAQLGAASSRQPSLRLHVEGPFPQILGSTKARRKRCVHHFLPEVSDSGSVVF